MKTTRRCLAAALASALVLSPALVAAHDNVVVHRRLAELSVQQLGNPFFFPYTGDVREGSYGEDVPATRSLGHFYNPETNAEPWFALGSGPAWQNSQDQYNAALGEYANGNYTGEDAAFYRMGRALHFIQDMTSPAHVHDDQHATDPEDFEDYGPAHINAYDFSNVVPKFAAVPTAEGYVKEISRVAYDMTRYQAVLDAFDGCPSQCQPNSLLRTMFPSLHYEDGGFFDGDVWEMDAVGKTDTFLGANDDWWITDESKVTDNGGRGGSSRIRGDGYIENTGGNATAPVPVVFNGQPNGNGETMLQLYSRFLYPEAIAYGAGLLQVFANAVGAPPPPSPTPSSTRTATATETPLPQGPTDTPTETPLVATATFTPTSTSTPTAIVPLCAATPRLGCRTTAPGKSLLLLRDRSGGERDRLLWKWTRGEVSSSEIGNPFSGTSYALCIYDDDGVAEHLALALEARAGDTCPAGACWRSMVQAYKYNDTSTSNDGLRQILVQSGIPGQGRFIVKAQGIHLPMPAPASGSALLAQSPQVRAQLVTTAGPVCWEGVYAAPAIRSTVDQFKDRN